MFTCSTTICKQTRANYACAKRVAKRVAKVKGRPSDLRPSMASLDDFFAKKDKRKKGKSKTFVTSELLAKTKEVTTLNTRLSKKHTRTTRVRV